MSNKTLTQRIGAATGCSRSWRWVPWPRCLLPLLLVGGLAVATHQAQAAQQTFWPTYQWPPPDWSFASTDATPILFANGASILYTRHYNLGHLPNPITPPASGSSTVYSTTCSSAGDNATWCRASDKRLCPVW